MTHSLTSVTYAKKCMNKTDEIFRDDCPYNNYSQTPAKRLLFVCSVGMLRSPTAQIVASQMGYNARACGSSINIALIPLSVNLINWAHVIIFLNQDNYLEALKHFKISEFDEDIRAKSVVWGVGDHYNWGDSVLYGIIRHKLIEMQEKDII